jgi:pimeloyl-ACP methyl ester carboxylesterase
LQPKAQQEFWYQAFHQVELCTELIDGQPDAVRSYLRHLWSHWSGPGYEPTSQHLDHLVSVYGPPGAFAASIAWYRAGAGSVAASLAERTPEPDQRIAVPTTVLWPEYDPLFPRGWSDRIGEFFAAATLTWLDDVGHFSPGGGPGCLRRGHHRRSGLIPDAILERMRFGRRCMVDDASCQLWVVYRNHTWVRAGRDRCRGGVAIGR